MLTGDSIVSARAVIKSLGIGQGIYVSGDDFEADTFKDKYPYHPVTVIYRASPHIKQKYVECLQKRGQTVMMVGDGPNDAAALAEAAVGVAIRSNESQMAQNIADIVVNNWTQIPDILEMSKEKQVIMGHVVDLVLLKHMLTGCTLLGIMIASFYNSVKDPADPFLMAAFNAIVFLMMTLYIATASSPSPSDNFIRGGQSGIVTGLALGAWINALPDDHSKVDIAICVQLSILLLYIASKTQGIHRYLWITVSFLVVTIGALVQGDKYGYYTSLVLSLVF
jgi:magnesium-transporting ATPase (P-type)